ncbi:hypothetical protein V2J09_005936 [Rumex salicifolius]
MDISIAESHQTSNCFTADDIPDWFLLEILLRLPVKSIFRFKCVSRHWHSLISDLSIAHSYTARTIEKNGYDSSHWTLLICYMNSNCTKIPPYYFGLQAASKFCNSEYLNVLISAQFQYLNQGSLKNIRLLACDSGLLLCCINQNWQEFYFVCNPLTNHSVSIPRRPQLHKWVSIGFAVEPINGSFRIARIAEFSSSSNVLDLEIYSSKQGKWVERKLICTSPISVCLFITHRQAVSYKGILHWREYNNRILAYDPKGETEQCRLIDMPRNRDRDGQGILRVSRGRLYYLEVRNGGIDLWELEDYGAGEWRLVHGISINDVCSTDSRVTRTVRSGRFALHPLALHPFDCDVVYLTCGERLAYFNLRTRMLEIQQNERIPLSCIDSLTVVPFVLPLWPTPVPKTQWQFCPL